VECVLYAVGSSFVEQVRESIDRLGWTIRGGVENVEASFRPEGFPLVAPDSIPPGWLSLPVSVPMMTPGHRLAAEREAVSHGFSTFLTVLDPTSICAPSLALGEGALVSGGTYLGAHVELGRLVVVGRSASVGHHACIEPYATLGPGVVVCGHVHVSRGAFVGAGAVVVPEITVGANAVVGAGAVVVGDVPAHTLVVGNPARAVREVAGYNDVSVA
jgi:sugar O-acyltransferase (sialic acid O-acetyltransferase NeuD family)